jgi:transposase
VTTAQPLVGEPDTTRVRRPVTGRDRPDRCGVLPLSDVVSFTARCPGCGRDRLWVEEREDTRVRARIICDCDC